MMGLVGLFATQHARSCKNYVHQVDWQVHAHHVATSDERRYPIIAIARVMTSALCLWRHHHHLIPHHALFTPLCGLMAAKKHLTDTTGREY